jgi:hypothetical protein|tara:strand:- start:2491 stop:3102 length:612 start_codon:yes stop_codon:yes gene_type:complete
MKTIVLPARAKEIADAIPHDKRIAVSVSGGWDSAVLWHIVYNECKKRGQECKPYTVPKIDGAQRWANEVIRQSGYEGETTLVGSVAAEDVSSYVTSGIREIIKDDQADIVYVGTNKYYDGMQPDHARQHPSAWGVEHLVLSPFFDDTKDVTVELAFDLGIAYDIMNITHSCTERDVGRCGYCPWCKERTWAFKEIGREDEGSN